MKPVNVVAIRPWKVHPYPNAGKAHNKADNVLKRLFSPATANTHWVDDISYIRTYQGWSYLACVLDLATKEVVGFAMAAKADADLAKQALRHALAKQQPDTSQ